MSKTFPFSESSLRRRSSSLWAEVRDKNTHKKMSVLDRFPHSTAELKRVKTVQFGVLSPDEIVSVFFLLFILFPPHARFAKSRVLRVCVRRV